VASVIKRLHVGGDETRLLTFARCVDETAVEHVVVVVNPTDQERDSRIGVMLQHYRDTGVDVVTLDNEVLEPHHRRGPGEIADAASVLRRLTAIFSERQIDVVDGRLEFGTVFGLAAGKLAGVSVVVSTYSPEYWRSVARYPLGQLVFSSLDALITDAMATVRDYDRWRISRHARLILIPNGIHPAVPARPRDEMRAVLGLRPDAHVVGQVARMIPRKGYDVLIRAARHVVDREPDTAFLLCGFAENPGYVRRLREMATSLSLEGHVTITSYQGPIGDVLGAIDVFAHLSRFDSSPIAVHEAMSAALPAVVSDVGGTPELVDDGVTGLLVPAGDSGAAAEGLLRLLRDPELSRRLGSGGLERYRCRHRPETMADAHVSLYRELLDEHRHRGRRRRITPRRR
jgi:glycosyltransferase involved in cell wall biosynthesis